MLIMKYAAQFLQYSHFEPDFTGEKSKSYILQRCIIYLKYLFFLDTLLIHKVKYSICDIFSCILNLIILF